MEGQGDGRLYPRRALDVVEESMGAFRVVVVHGARQVGKTTLARLVAGDRGADYVTLDHAADLEAVLADPPTFLAVAGTPLVIDEVQRAGDPLVIGIKATVDRDQRPGRYLLTGSTNFLTVPGISESLAGRADIVTLWPLSMGERTGGGDDFVDRAFAGAGELLGHEGTTPDRDEYLESICRGGFPAVQAISAKGRRRWFARFVETVLQREIEVASDIRRGDALAAMVRFLAATTGQELVITTMADRLGIDRGTAQTYEPWLETVFLVHRVPAWSRNLAKVVHRPKLYLTDTGIAAALLGKDPNALRRPTEPATGPLMETFVAAELAKQLTWSNISGRLGHHRTSDGMEVDLIIEADDGRVVAIEVKATSTPRLSDFRWLARLRDQLDHLGDDFRCGVVLHTGSSRLPFGDRLVALPIADLWT